MKKIIQIVMLAGVMTLAFSACKKEETQDPPASQFGDFKLVFDAVWAANMDPFFMNAQIFHPKTGDSLTFTTFKFYVSNIKLKKSDGTLWEANESYHLVDLADPTRLTFDFTNIPAGTYTGVLLTMGVDSARNVSGNQDGDLDPVLGMYWNATDGYIMIKAEGQAPQSPTGTFAYHLGGFSGPDKVVMDRDINFPTSGPLTISANSTPNLHIVVNPARLFHSYGSVTNGPEILAPGFDAATMAFTFNDWVRFSQIN